MSRRIPIIAKLFIAYFFISIILFYWIANYSNSNTCIFTEKHNKNILNNFNDIIRHQKNVAISNSKEPKIFLITPTHTRLHQKAELTRLCYTFMHINNVVWIVIEDSEFKTDLVTNFLKKCKVQYVHLNFKTPSVMKLKSSEPNWKKPRGVWQRNKGLNYLRKTDIRNGVVYFADDDNVYDLDLFDEMRSTKIISVWPVGLVGKLKYESPILENGIVVNWRTFWKPNRPFALDMAGFAVNINIIKKYPDAFFSENSNIGYVESDFITALNVKRSDLEPKADNCRKILVWHTRTETPIIKNEIKMSDIMIADDNIEI